ncbi:MAG: GGDEF domain-containing protein [Spirochaetales bacterium]|nr:GGDEF domain-containing protein [Spirochaetales bacterium]
MDHDSMPVKTELLKNTDMFSSLLKHELKVISDHSEIISYKAGDSVFSSGNPGDSLYIVKSGEILITKQEPYAPVIDIARFIRGNCFGELDMLTESIREVSAHATEESELLVFPKTGTAFTDLLNDHPQISARILHTLLAGISSRIRSANALIKENSPIIQELKKQVYRDKLTGIYNDTFLLEQIRKHINAETPFSLLISKPDNFKELNDEYGHDAGDRVIKIMARQLRDFIADDNRTVRYKGNAMAVLLPGADREKAEQKAKEIRSFISHLNLDEITRGKAFCLSASVGVSLYPAHYTDPELMVTKTHELPLTGRKQGGNRILFPEDIRGEGGAAE